MYVFDNLKEGRDVKSCKIQHIKKMYSNHILEAAYPNAEFLPWKCSIIKTFQLEGWGKLFRIRDKEQGFSIVNPH